VLFDSSFRMDLIGADDGAPAMCRRDGIRRVVRKLFFADIRSTATRGAIDAAVRK